MKHDTADSEARYPVDVSGVVIGGGELVIIAGPCVIESRESCLRHAEQLLDIAGRAGVPFIFKSSYDKANRTSLASFRGPGPEEGLEILSRVRSEFGCPVLSDVHSVEEVGPAAEVLDMIQIPAFLSRQTDLLVRAAESGVPVNVKKGQFLAPSDAAPIVEKLRSSGAVGVTLTERGSSFGYNNLVVDMRSLGVMRALGVPVIFDATHSVQLPGALGGRSGGEREFVPLLSKAAVAAGCDAVFMEVHEAPDKALCDGPNMLALDGLPVLWATLKDIWRVVRE